MRVISPQNNVLKDNDLVQIEPNRGKNAVGRKSYIVSGYVLDNRIYNKPTVGPVSIIALRTDQGENMEIIYPRDNILTSFEPHSWLSDGSFLIAEINMGPIPDYHTYKINGYIKKVNGEYMVHSIKDSIKLDSNRDKVIQVLI